jgi:hypothetical protein
MNDIPLTIRLPHELNVELTATCKKLGMTKTNCLRGVIHDLVDNDVHRLVFSFQGNGEKDRMVFNVNQLTYNILDSICKKHDQSMNAVVTAVSLLALERSSKWLQSISK